MDWGVFHVEQSFHGLWREYNRILKQRNAALRAGARQPDIQVWDKGLVDTALKITALRENYLANLLPVLENYSEQLIGFIPQFSYSRGWQKDEDLADKLKDSLETDRAQGYTRAGPHRADLHIKHESLPAQASFSRGQQKLLVSAMRLAQITHLKQQSGQQTVLLVDDLAAELDEEKRARMLALLKETGAQLFVTVTEPDLVDVSGWDEIKLFHVEHGAIKEVVY
jgi:DNA replication and repair protein RecF